MSTPADAEPASGNPVRNVGVLADAGSLWEEVWELICDQLSLAALETRRAGESLVSMVVTGVMIAVLLVTAWLGVVAAVIMVLVGTGISAYFALLIGVGANTIVALILCLVVRRKSRHLQWAASIRSLDLDSASGARSSPENSNANP